MAFNKFTLVLGLFAVIGAVFGLLHLIAVAVGMWAAYAAVAALALLLAGHMSVTVRRGPPDE